MPAVAAAFAEREILPEGYVLPAYAAVEIAHAALAEADRRHRSADLSGRDFATAIGTVSFDDKGDLTENPYRAVPLRRDEVRSRSGALMFRTGPRNLITDVAGLRVGNAADDRLKSGVTVVRCDEPAVAGVQVLGGAPGTRETDLLEPHNSVETVNAIVLSGGSAFGLDAASGVQAALRETGVGFRRARQPRPDRAGRDPVRPAQWRRQGLGPLSALSRARLRGRCRPRRRISPSAQWAPAPAR